jgi:ATP adenylyltransferase
VASGGIWNLVERRTENALDSGALEPIHTATEVVEDEGVLFVVRLVDSLTRKRYVTQTAENEAALENPFVPYDDRLFVAELSSTHFALLNKYNVFEHHLLIVTRAFEDQQSPLGAGDFEALARCLLERECLGFYNAGVLAGASQRHKHLQLVPLPIGAGEIKVPIEARLPLELEPSRVVLVTELRFRNAFIRLPASQTVTELGNACHTAYAALLRGVGLRTDATDSSGNRGSYNLLITRGWMLLVPRTRERFGDISVNALGFAGALLVRDEAQLARVRTAGPMNVLRHVTGTLEAAEL